MHEAAQPKEQEQVTARTRRRGTPRPKKYFAVVKHKQFDLTTGRPPEPEFLEFADKAAMRETLSQPKYEGIELRIIRGHEMNVKVRHSIGVN